MFTRWPGSSLYTLATEPPQVATSAQVSTSGQVAPPCSCRLLSHQTLLWHQRHGNPSLPCLCGMHSRLFVSGLPKSLPPLPPSPAPPCLPCVEGRQRAAPHSSSFPPTTAPMQTLHMDVWGPARVSEQGRERYFLLVVDDYTRYTTVFPLRSKGEVPDILIPWIRAVCLQLREPFHQDLPVLHLHFDRGGEFSFDLLQDFCRGEGILQSFTLPNSPQQNRIAERRIGLVMEFYHPTLRRVLPSQDVTFDESIPFYRLFPYRSAPLPPPPLFLAPGPPQIDPLPPQGPAPSGVSQVDPLPSTVPVQVAVVSDAAPSAASGGAASGGAEPGGAGSEGAGSGGVEPEGAESEGAESGGDEPRGAALSGGPTSASPRLSSQQLREWLVQRAHRHSGAPGAGGTGDPGAGGTATTGHGGARTVGAGATGTGGVGCVGAGDPTEPGAAGAGGAGAGVAGVGGASAGGAGTTGAGAVDPGAGGAGGTVRPRPYFVPLLQQVLGVPSSTDLPPPFLCPPPDQPQPPLQPASPLPVPSPYTEQSGGLTEQREPVSCPVSPVGTARPAPRSRAPPVPGTHTIELPHVASPTVARLLATTVTYPSFESTDASALIAESVPASPPSVGDIPTPCSYAEAITGPYSSQWQAAMDAKMASWKSTGTYVDEVPPPGANIVDRMWIFLLKRPPGTQWSLRRPVYDLCRAPREWHDTLRTTLAALGFAPSTADPSLFLCTDTSLPPFYVLVYVDDLVFATADTEAPTLVKTELQKRHTCTDRGELRSYLGLQITRDRARRTITLTQSHMVHHVLSASASSTPRHNSLLCLLATRS
ncbi:unnamed protein product [Closterium sp. NIES-53]